MSISVNGPDRILLYIDSGNPRLRAPLCTRAELEAEIREQVLKECESGSTWLRLSVLSKQERRHRVAELVRERTTKLTANGGMGALHCNDHDGLGWGIRAKYGSKSSKVNCGEGACALLKYPKLGLVNIQQLIDSVEASSHHDSAACPTAFELDSIFPQPGDIALLLIFHVETLASFPKETLVHFASRCVACSVPVYIAVFGAQPSADDMGLPELLLIGLCLETAGWYAQCPMLGTPTFINKDSAISPMILKEFSNLVESAAANGSTATGSGEITGTSCGEADLIDLGGPVETGGDGDAPAAHSPLELEGIGTVDLVDSLGNGEESTLASPKALQLAEAMVKSTDVSRKVSAVAEQQHQPISVLEGDSVGVPVDGDSPVNRHGGSADEADTPSPLPRARPGSPMETRHPFWAPGDVGQLEDDLSSGIEAAAMASAEYLAGFELLPEEVECLLKSIISLGDLLAE
ncbi:hypothetical protein Pmar_PMAR013471 [Perkinsus marinus ATCC 50983]|uniref:Uncharacterized protein n=1 Tax=Perkinsus marinus (strain ATCC 50983 / TXsc) TaxID=423536 RepID=C5L1X8_PERM5|nr:hypothetical protein Pmar_PMAR013471 [Perkinsus marinus ATCC 50983]EER09247.1 hypothetical protein Pmar_PMAR013471 [Perkinsus marinus ATCC 50983]|eukprot:XP_002777431.1 hypothetical protein Pmar_PMAR013471 [Perkinsus marinus ATCC 50983]